MLNNKAREIFDRYVSKIQCGEPVHRYDLEAEFENYNKKYKNPQLVELLLKDATKSNGKYKHLFEKLYGNMNKYNNGGFSL